MYVKKSNGPKIGPCSKPTLTRSQRKFWPWNKTLWYLLSRKLWKSIQKLSETPIVFNLYTKPSCQTLSKDGKLSKDYPSKDSKFSAL